MMEGKVVFSKVDCTIETELCSKNEIKGYPTVLLFQNRKRKVFNGNRSKNGIISWLRKNVRRV
jgi:protein disulfide-isomerase A1